MLLGREVKGKAVAANHLLSFHSHGATVRPNKRGDREKHHVQRAPPQRRAPPPKPFSKELYLQVKRRLSLTSRSFSRWLAGALG